MAIEIAPPDTNPAEGRKRRREMHGLWRVSAWGCGAAIALAALAITTQTEGGSERLVLALSPGNSRPLTIEMAELKQRVVDKDVEAKRLESEILTLAADRDRLTNRLANLEHSLEDMTGSIKRQAALATPTLSPLAMPAATPAAETVPMPPVRTATASPDTTEPAKLEFGIDLGGAATLEVLNARWAAVKANFGPLLTGLHPLAAHDQRPGVTGYRLVIGPVANPAAGMQLCARFVTARVTCRTAKFDGEQLAQR
jgi:hypothetical protein